MIVAAVIYTAVMGIGMFDMKTFMGISHGHPEMTNLCWFVLILFNAITVLWVTRYSGWQAIGFCT